MRVKEESEGAGWKLNIEKTKIMASDTITSWQIKGENEEIETYFLFLGSKITADGECSHELRRWLLLGRKAMTNVDSVLKSRDMTLPTKVPRVKAMVFPVVMYGCESWTIKEGRTPKNWCLQTVVMEKTSESPSDSKRIKLISLKCKQPWILIVEGLMLKLKLQYFGHLMWTADLLENSLMLEQIEGRRWRWCYRMTWQDGITDAIDMNLGGLLEMVRDREAWSDAVHEITKSWTRPGDWPTTTTSSI